LELAAARDEGGKERLEGQLEVAKAQLELHQDELTEATENLSRAGGDPQARILRLKAAYEAAQKEPRPAPTLAPDAADLSADSLLARVRAWAWQRSKLSRLSRAMQESSERVQRLTAGLAEQEWRKATTRYRVRTFSPVPGINVVPTSTGIEIHVRYITRAHERHETRRGLYQAVVELMHGKRAEVESAGAA
jgi:hypothetical protein